MKRLNIWLTLTSGEVCLAGELIVAEPDSNRGGALNGEFRYADGYIDRPDAFPLDPNLLPLTTEIFSANRPKSGVHGVFEDALPDDWGRRLLVRRYHLGRHHQRVPDLLSYLGQGLGALGFASENLVPKINNAPIHQLDDLLEAARAFEKGDELNDEELASLFQAGSSPGGARPKTLISDAGMEWIAKFPSIKDQFDVVSIEAATLQLAQNAGIKVPDFKCRTCGAHKVLLSKRFDVTKKGRRHVISMQSLLQADNYYMLGYQDMAEILRRFSSQPSQDLQALYRQMVFNAQIGNTDDHLKNFSMLHDDNGYRLTPAYDLLPNISKNNEHVLRFGSSAETPTKEVLTHLAKQYNLQTRQAENVIDEVATAVSQWKQVFADYEVPGDEIQQLSKDINKRIFSVPDTST